MEFPGLLHAKTVRSTRPRAEIVSMEKPEMPPGYYLIDKDDVPGRLYPQLYARDYPLFADGEVNYLGEAICLIVGPDREKVYELCQAVEVEYRDLPAITSLEDSLAGQVPPIFGEDNVFIRKEFERGQVDEALAASHRVFTGEYWTGYQDHLYLETLRMVADWREDELVIYGPSQGPDPLPRFLAQVFGWQPDRFRAVCTTVGGGFGGKIEPPVILAAHAALAAYKAKRPVLLAYDRDEDMMSSTKRHPARVGVTVGVDREGRLTAVEFTIQLMAGAYTWFCPVVLDIAVKMAGGTYAIPNLRVTGSAHATNHVMPGAMRGFGVVQTAFALETLLDRVARELGQDPLDYKVGLALRKGDLTSTGGEMREDILLPEIVSRIKNMSGYAEKRKLWAKQSGHKRKGIGAALYAFGAPHTMGQGPRRMPRPLAIARKADGQVVIRTNIVDLGQGIETTFKKIAGKVLGVPYDRISMPPPDSKNNPPTLGTGASLSIVLFGKSLERAALRLKARWDQPGDIEEVEDFTEPDYLEWDEEKLQGDSFHTYSWGGIVVEVEADALTGQVEVNGVWSAHDIGTPIDLTIATGQVDGAVAQGIGLGIMEDLQSQGGRLMQTSLADYIIPSAVDLPAMEHEFVDGYYQQGPYGAKSVGEMPIVGGSPAIASAISQALGVEVARAPATPEYLVDLIKRKEGLT
jgi:CO/xanthine dehydrogenase Mo-binding subunit